jgi:uncharacterized protein (TIGR03437 family)
MASTAMPATDTAEDANGLDQINIEIPASVKGRGEVPVLLTVDGETSNLVTLNVQ